METIVARVIVAAIVLYVIAMYNTLVSSRNRVRNAFSDPAVREPRAGSGVKRVKMLLRS